MHDRGFHLDTAPLSPHLLDGLRDGIGALSHTGRSEFVDSVEKFVDGGAIGRVDRSRRSPFARPTDRRDYATAKWHLLGAVPSIIGGAFAAQYALETLLRGIFGVGLLDLGGFLVYYEPPEKCVPGEGEGPFLERKNAGRGQTVVESTDGKRHVFDTCWRPPGVALATIGGFVTGLISAGLPEIAPTQLVIRCRVPSRVAIATSVFVLGVATVAGATVHALSATPVWYVVAWSIPGVLIGGTIGTRVGKHVPSDLMEVGLGVIFGLVGAIVLVTTDLF